ncbi:MAG: protein translocase subunit SecF, partial [Sphingobium yanoikuyae]|nr:protein translocase subunit SecF [Sphingobium yanoikuyae]
MKLLKLVPDNTNIRFLRWRVPFYATSLLLMAASIVLVFTKGLNLGVDFVGGQSIRVEFAQQEAPVAQVREEIDALGYGEPIIQRVGGPNQITIRMKLPDDAPEGLANRMVADMRSTLEQHHPGVEIGSARAVSGKVSDELFHDGM